MNLEFTSILTGGGIVALIGWISSFFALRKDERSILVQQITTERTKWRGELRELTEAIVVLYHKENRLRSDVMALRSKLVTSLNPHSGQDNDIISHFDRLFFDDSEDMDVFMRRIALLLKHDWERVKWECAPIYLKPLYLLYPKAIMWSEAEYRDISTDISD